MKEIVIVVSFDSETGEARLHFDPTQCDVEIGDQSWTWAAGELLLTMSIDLSKHLKEHDGDFSLAWLMMEQQGIEEAKKKRI